MINGHNVPIEQRTPIDFIEPELDIRRASLRYVDVLEALGTRLGDALKTGDIRTANTAFWGIAYGLGLAVCDGMTMTQRASFVGVTRATISKTAKSFAKENGLPPSFYMKSAQSHSPYAEARRTFISNGCKSKFKVI